MQVTLTPLASSGALATDAKKSAVFGVVVSVPISHAGNHILEEEPFTVVPLPR